MEQHSTGQLIKSACLYLILAEMNICLWERYLICKPLHLWVFEREKGSGCVILELENVQSWRLFKTEF